jgi:UDP-glucose 4-epimerase/GDP-4-dehydro-6-deoxy-D-mannose reductase
MKRSQIFEQPAFIPIFTDYNHFLGKCVGVTGQNGLLGGILSERLTTHNIHVEAYPGDITDVTSLRDWVRKHRFDYFFHFAAIVPVSRVMDEPLKAYNVNVVGSYNICSQIIETQANCWLFLASSSHVYKSSPISEEQVLKVGSAEEPHTFYGVTKLVAEQISRPILDQYKVDYCIGRIFSFSSMAQNEPYLVPTLRRKIEETAENGILEIINPDSIRDIMDADTIIDCVLHLAQKRFKGILNIGSGKGTSIKDIGYTIAKLLKKKIQIRGVNKSQPNSLVADVRTLKQVLLENK